MGDFDFNAHWRHDVLCITQKSKVWIPRTVLKGWVKNEPLVVARQRVAYAMREYECFGYESDPDELLKSTIGDGNNSRLATFEDIYDVLIHGPLSSDAGPVKYPTGNWRRLSDECDAACKMHKGASTLHPSDDPD